MYKLEWDMRARWLFAAALAVAGLWAGWTVYTWPHVVQFVPSFAVAYSRGLGQEVVVQVVNQSGHPVDFCASLIGWFPNGTLAKLDDVCGRGEAKANVERFRKYAEAWKNSPGEVGVIVLLTYVNGTTPDGNYTLARTAKSFTIQPGRVLRGESVRATIKVKGKPPTQPPKGRQAAALALQSPGQMALQSWPPGMMAQCITGSVVVCYYWILDTVYVNQTNTEIPLVAARVSTGWEASLINDVYVNYVLAASSSNYVYFSGGAAITYVVNGVSMPQGYSADIYTLAISDSSFKLSKGLTMIPYQQGPGIVVVGFKGDYAVARYSEVQCIVSIGASCAPTNYYAILYMVRPNVTNPTSYGEVLSLSSYVGDMFNLVSKYWNNHTEYGGSDVSVNSITTVSENNGINILALGIPLIKEPQDTIVVNTALNLAVGVGASTQITALGTASAALNTNNPKYFIYAVYYLPPVKFEYQGGYYPLPSLFVDFRVGVSTLDRDAEGTT
ncbi:hypothetical protein [Pyrobaculum calidifontis]|uniref:Uncharacterized protein n=1 Tax=Pyrobaculum calidifontis (strain DSM 21063 / JCM 11548 / VA1) TaxID=410359 RepID=A3MU70_PYRCJ|nr:hypothetical protein [Pyrobaculum calidifontis]ABO08187.1 hypothetical protein Pcal_0761 [Pyrobaculum calidifontis JCM 11548]